MKINVFLEREDKEAVVDVSSFNELFNKLNVDKNTVLITRNNELITEDEQLKENDEIKLLSVISGG